jgi:hypothetical protein
MLPQLHAAIVPLRRNWNPGDDVIIVPSVSDAQAREKFPGGWKAPKPYLRIVPSAFCSRLWRDMSPVVWASNLTLRRRAPNTASSA